jgi:trigger factor
METSIEKLPKSKIKIIFELTPDELKPYLNRAVSEMGKNLNVKGFRPGTAPQEIIEKEIGKEKIFQEGIQEAVRKTYVEIILEKKIQAIGTPEVKITKQAENNPLVFEAIVAVLPEVKLGDYKNLRIEKSNAEVEVKDEEIENSLKYLQESRAKLITVKRGAKKGDRVEIDFITRLGDVKIENGESKNHPLIIDQGRFVKGFEEQLEGMEENQTKNFNLNFPDDYQKKDLAGKKVDFEVKMNLVQERQMSAIDDEFAKELGGFKDLENLKKSVKEGILSEKKEKEKEKRRQKIMEKLVQESEMELPDVLIEQETEKMFREFEMNVKKMALEPDKYLEKIGKTADELKKEWRGQAEKRIKGALVLKEIAEKEKIEISNEELEEETNKVLKNISSANQAKKDVDLEDLKNYTKDVLMNEKVFEMMEKN